MKLEDYLKLHDRVIAAGYLDEVDWAKSIKPCDDADDFAGEYVWVVIHSGLNHDVARKIEARVWEAIQNGTPVSNAFRHNKKTLAIEYLILNRRQVFCQYQKAEDKLVFLESLPHIGPVTKYHLGKNLGLDCVKPDRHLVRIANRYDTTPGELCARLADESGHTKATVDQVLWRAATLNMYAEKTYLG